MTAIIGPNGSGKSTLLHAIAGLLPISAGDLEVLGTSPDGGQRGVSYVLQYTTVPVGTPLTVAETVMMGRYPRLGLLGRPSRDDRSIVADAMDRLEITDLARRHLTELSGGQRQRVYVAQGIAQEHQMLLLDEPARGCTVVLTTHDLAEARAADHVILMGGRVIASGPPQQALTRDNLIAAYGLGALHDTDLEVPDFPTEHHDHKHEHGSERGF